ncbi:hypothetical protein STEG23_031444 [Scotinomys teguina]
MIPWPESCLHSSLSRTNPAVFIKAPILAKGKEGLLLRHNFENIITIVMRKTEKLYQGRCGSFAADSGAAPAARGDLETQLRSLHPSEPLNQKKEVPGFRNPDTSLKLSFSSAIDSETLNAILEESQVEDSGSSRLQTKILETRTITKHNFPPLIGFLRLQQPLFCPLLSGNGVSASTREGDPGAMLISLNLVSFRSFYAATKTELRSVLCLDVFSH